MITDLCSFVIHSYLVKQCEIDPTEMFDIVVYFLTLNAFFANQFHTVWSITIVFQQVPLFKQFPNIFRSFADSCEGENRDQKVFTG